MDRRAMARWRLPIRLFGNTCASSTPLSVRVARNGAPRPFSSFARKQEEQQASMAKHDIAELESTSHDTAGPSEAQIEKFASHLKRRRLVPSRYHFRPPRYYRGPLHPHQPPPKTSPASREYVPGPFSLPRMLQTHESVLESDLMTLFYQHIPPGTQLPEPAPRLRGWDDSSPYHKNRPLRGPRGRSQLPLKRKIITYRNVPTMEKITVHAYLGQGAKDSQPTHVAGMVLQAIGGKRATVIIAKKGMTGVQRANVVQKKGKPIGINVELRGEQMWHFLSTFLMIIAPKIKDWPGMKARSGDRSGNYGITVTPEVLSLWPEIAVNLDSYPADSLPTLDIHLQTTAKTDRDGRVLLSALGLPFVSGGNR